ncbi:hypothetical protein EJV47_22260 [Hymenobacter gummosus]|uniref:Uncharacterized protein n=1 Tax=Hymenobacter gummosus TaxID=1776032 RepID=A0A3S0HK59_9BACT|nr:hypothetical protein [Hymenobacter gummosus]RTQ46256.1 hypothetical protein EJV47_22260 [Hymenobacter gummosus]
MSEIFACHLDADPEEQDAWHMTTKSFAFGVFVFGTRKELEEKYAGVLTPEEIRLAQPAPEAPFAFDPTPEELAAAVAREAARFQQFAGRPHPNLELLTQRVQEENERNLERVREYQATRPDIRRPAELLAVLQKIEQHLRASGIDSYNGRDDFRFDIDFACLGDFLREADRQGKLVCWSY